MKQHAQDEFIKATHQRVDARKQTRDNQNKQIHVGSKESAKHKKQNKTKPIAEK